MRNSNTVSIEDGLILIVPDQELSRILGPHKFTVLALNDITITLRMHARSCLQVMICLLTGNGPAKTTRAQIAAR